MMTEHAICSLLSGMLPSGRQNLCFESDAEIIVMNGRPALFTTDEFSGEDLFREEDAYGLGWNIAAGAMSDILACGGSPLYYAHALTVDPRWDEKYLADFGCGLRDLLETAGAHFIGGDCGRAEAWRCTASVIGACEGRPVLRRGASAGDDIYLTGPVGAGNLEAALKLQKRTDLPLRLPWRQKESAVMRKYATAAMDTSDGVLAALNTLADLNGCGYAVGQLPYLADGLRFCQEAALPKTLLFLGGCGEYELLFAVNPKDAPQLLAGAKESGCTFYRLGSLQAAGRILQEDGQALDLSSLRIQGRDCASPQQYLHRLICWLAEQGKGLPPLPPAQAEAGTEPSIKHLGRDAQKGAGA